MCVYPQIAGPEKHLTKQNSDSGGPPSEGDR